MDRHAAHGNIVALMLARLVRAMSSASDALGGVVEKQLIEIAHPIEQQIIGMGSA